MGTPMFDDNWLQLEDYKEWLAKVDNDPSRSFCRVCGYVLRSDLEEIKAHGQSETHTQSMMNKSVDPEVPNDLPVLIVRSELAGDDSEARAARRRSYQKRYRVEWESEPELQGWLSMCEGDESKACCNVCRIYLRAHKHDLILHSRSKKHTKLMVEHFGSEMANGDMASIIASATKKARIDEQDGTTVEIVGHETTICPDSILDTQLMDSGDNTQEPMEAVKSVAKKNTGNRGPMKVKIEAQPFYAIQNTRKRRRRFTAADVISAMDNGEFTGYEILQIVKAAVPKL